MPQSPRVLASIPSGCKLFAESIEQKTWTPWACHLVSNISISKVPPVEIEPGISRDPLWCLSDWTYLTLLLRPRFFRCFSHSLLILVKSSKSKCQMMHQNNYDKCLSINTDIRLSENGIVTAVNKPSLQTVIRILLISG